MKLQSSGVDLQSTSAPVDGKSNVSRRFEAEMFVNRNSQASVVSAEFTCNNNGGAHALLSGSNIA